MSARMQLFDLYEQWRHITEAETKAIELAAWWKVNECQGEKHRLQNEIVDCTEAFNQEILRHGLDRGEFERQFRGIVSELIVMETHNAELVDHQRSRARVKMEELDQSQRNLRQVQAAYVPKRRNGWHSYS